MKVTINVHRFAYTVGGMSKTADAEIMPPLRLDWPDDAPKPAVGMRIVMGKRRGAIHGITVDLLTGEVVLGVDEYVARETEP
jgi:hypothetical protein